MTTPDSCSSCRRPKAPYACEQCQASVCKDCRQFLDAATFAFLPKIPAELTHTYYCPACFSTHVEPAQQTYEETMERARGVYFFFTTHKRPVRLLKQAPHVVRVEQCEDRDETILRLAFLAAMEGFNAIVQAEVTSTKVRNGAYQTSRWTGVGLPAQVDAEKLERQTGR